MSIRVSLAIGLVACLLTTPALAEVPREFDGKPITRVEVAGESAVLVAPEDLGIAIGTRLSRGMLRTAIHALLANGRFTDVQVEGLLDKGGVRLVVWLTPRVVLRRIDVSGNHELGEEPIRDALGLSVGSEVKPADLDAVQRSLSKLYAAKGYLGAQIAASLRDTDDPSIKVLIVRIEEGTPTRIAQIRFDGQEPLDPGRVVLGMDSAVGDVLDRSKLDEDVRNVEASLRQKGFLEAALGAPVITIQGDEAKVVIPSHVGPRYRVVLRGNTRFSPSELREVLAVDTERLTSIHLRHTFAERIQDFYARHGYTGTKIKIERLREKKQILLQVTIAPGQQLRVVSVSFAGATHFSRDFLRDQLSSYLTEDLPGSPILAPVDSEVADALQHGAALQHARQVPVPPLNNPEEFYYEPAYAKAIEHVTELYRGEGFLSVRVGPLQLQRIGAGRAAVFIPVSEGPRTLLHEIVVHGTTAISPRELLTVAALWRDQPFSYLALEQARRRVLDAYHELGYVFAKVEPTVSFSGDRTRASIELQVVESVPVHVDNVVIEGASHTSARLVRRVLKLSEGDLFRPSLARDSERELATLGVFTGVSVALQDPELPARRKALLVTVSERRNQFLGFTAGLSTGQGARGGFEYGYRNLFGQAVAMTLRVQLAYQLFFVDQVFADRFRKLAPQDQLERRISLGTQIPRLPGFGRVRTSLDLVHLRDNERDFGFDQNAAGLTFTHNPIAHVTVTLGGDLENNSVDLFVSEALQDYLKTVQNPRLRKLLRVPEGSSTLVAARSSISYDRRDSPFTPTRGYFLSFNTELARTLTGAPDQSRTVSEFVSRFLKLSVTASAYVPVGPIVLAGQLRTGRIVHLTANSKTYPNRAFFLGGVDSMRGYLEDELIPQDIAEQIAADPKLDPNAIVRSGDAFVLLRGEVRFPIYRALHGGLFSDVGNLWADAAKFDPFRLRPTAGVGIRIDTPVGPIALDYGFNLAPRPELRERTSALHFSIGLF